MYTKEEAKELKLKNIKKYSIKKDKLKVEILKLTKEKSNLHKEMLSKNKKINALTIKIKSPGAIQKERWKKENKLMLVRVLNGETTTSVGKDFNVSSSSVNIRIRGTCRRMYTHAERRKFREINGELNVWSLKWLRENKQLFFDRLDCF